MKNHDFHLLLGVLLSLGFGWVLRRPFGSRLPLFIVLVFELIDEAFDFTRYYVDRYTREPGPTLVDTALITLSPLVIVLGSGPIDVMAAI